MAGIFQPRVIDDAAVGDIVLVSESLARSDWAAVRDQVAVAYPSAADATAHLDDFLDLRAGLWVYDDAEWRSVATTGITRFLGPFTVAGYVVMAAAGLSVLNVFVLGLVQRRRERAALRAIGVTPGQEQAVIMANAALLGLLVAGVAMLGGVGLTYLWSLGSPVYYGIKIDWGVLPLALRTGVAAVFGIVLIAAAVSRIPCSTAGDGRGAAHRLAVHFAVQLWTAIARVPKPMHVLPHRLARHRLEHLGWQRHLKDQSAARCPFDQCAESRDG